MKNAWKFAAALALCAAQADAQSTLTVAGREVQLHGFVQQGFVFTSDNNFLTMADAYASEHIFAMRYINWAGTRWIVTTVEVLSPRLLLRLGGVYNGPTAA